MTDKEFTEAFEEECSRIHDLYKISLDKDEEGEYTSWDTIAFFRFFVKGTLHAERTLYTRVKELTDTIELAENTLSNILPTTTHEDDPDLLIDVVMARASLARNQLRKALNYKEVSHVATSSNRKR